MSSPLLGYVMRREYPALVSRWMANGSARSYMEKMPDVPVMQMVSHRRSLYNSFPDSCTLVTTFTKARGIAAGLLYLHDHDVIHADLKSVLIFFVYICLT